MYNIDQLKNKILCGDTLDTLRQFPNECIDCIVTSPPYYGLRDYGVEGQLGLEKTLDEYLNKLLLITSELKRVLKKTGTMFWNHGDSYNGSGKGGDSERIYAKRHTEFGKISDVRRHGKPTNLNTYPTKCLFLQNFRLIQKMIDEQNWILRNVIIWHKPNCMPSSVKDRFTVDFEPVFFLTKSNKYWFEQQYEELGEDKRIAGIRRARELGYSGKGSYQDWYNNERKKQSWHDHSEDSRKGFGQQTRGQSSKKPQIPHPLGRNMRSVWKIPTHPFAEAHFATFPEKLIEPMIKAECPKQICNKCSKAREPIYKTQKQHSIGATSGAYWKERNFIGDNTVKNMSEKVGYTDCGCNAGFEGGVILDPFMGAGTTAVVAKKLHRNYIGIELNEEYIKIAETRINQTAVPMEI